jgi:hypothetical protein
MKKLALSFVLGLIILSIVNFISADVILPGYKSISIENKITNIKDFSDYVFIIGSSLENRGPGMVQIQVVGADGIIPNEYYKFSSPSVFAIQKEKWDEEKMAKFMEGGDGFESGENVYEEYRLAMESIGAKEVIKDLDNVMQIPETSAKESEVREFVIELEGVKEEPDSVKNERNYWKYFFFLGIPLIALVFIILKIRSKK